MNTQNSNVTTVKLITNKETNEVFTPNPSLGKDGKVYGYIMFEQLVIDLDSRVGGVKPIKAIKSFSLEAYEKAKEFLVAGREFTGKIIVIESLTEEPGSKPKRAGDQQNAPFCTLNGRPIYRRTEYTSDLNAENQLIKHDNTAEIKAFQAATKAVALNA